jgi:hypothetical protein
MANIYERIASLGKIYGTVGAAVLVVVALGMLGGSIFLLKKQSIYTLPETLTVISSTAAPGNVLLNGLPIPNYTVIGTITGCVNYFTLIDYPIKPAVGSKIPVFAQPNCIGTYVQTVSDATYTRAYIMLAFAILLFLIGSGKLYLSYKYKTFK